MLRYLILFCLFMPVPASAEDFHSDGFGIVPSSEVSETRAAWSGLQDSGPSSSFVSPEETETVLIIVGPKSLVAGVDEGHAVAIALDRYGNPVADGTGAVFRLGDEHSASAETLHGLADVLFLPDPVAGLYTAGIDIGGQQSPRATYRVTADLHSVVPGQQSAPEPVEIETYATLATTTLSDQYGNLVEDGTGTTTLLFHEDGSTSVLVSFVVDGVARANFLARDVASDGRFATTLGASTTSAETLLLQQATPTEEPRVQVWAVPAINAVGLAIGPITTSEGYLLNDGSRVAVRITAANGEVASVEGWTLDGHFEANAALNHTSGPFQVEFVTPIGRHSIETEISLAPVGAFMRIRQ